jgi:photosystem II stability/assembly factor-like uncharacterized protein
VNGWRGELRVSRDRAETWSQIGEGLPRGLLELAVDPGDGDFMLAGFESGVSRSLDGGANWEPGRGVSGRVVGFHIDQTSPKESRRCFAGTAAGVFQSQDGGKTWEQIGQGLPEKGLLDFAGGSSSRENECVLYCTVGSEMAGGKFVGGVYRSTDRGRRWKQAMGPGIDVEERVFWGRRRVPQYDLLLTTDVRPLTVYALTRRPGSVYRSDDGGESWRAIFFGRTDNPRFNLEPNYLTAELGSSESNLSGCGINPTDPEMVITTDWMCCQITRDGGSRWDTLHTRRAPEQGVAGKGQRWENTGLTVTSTWHYYIDPFEKNRHYIAYTDIKFARSDDAGKTWYSQWEPPLRNTTYELAFDPEVRGKIWGAFGDLHDIPNMNVISGRHYRPQAGGGAGLSTDFGETWSDTSQGLPDKPVTSIVLDPRSPKEARVLYASCFEAGVFKSTDGGRTWVSKSHGLRGPRGRPRACRLILHNDGTLFVLLTAPTIGSQPGLAGAGLYRSRDGGESWECITRSKALRWPKDFDVDPRDSDVIYLGAGDLERADEGGLYKTTDGGQTWRRIAREGRETFGATVHPKRPDWVYMALCEAAPGPGLWLSKDGGETWKPFWGIPFRNIQRIAFDPDDDNVIYVTTFGGSVWKGPAEE